MLRPARSKGSHHVSAGGLWFIPIREAPRLVGAGSFTHFAPMFFAFDRDREGRSRGVVSVMDSAGSFTWVDVVWKGRGRERRCRGSERRSERETWLLSVSIPVRCRSSIRACGKRMERVSLA